MRPADAESGPVGNRGNLRLVGDARHRQRSHRRYGADDVRCDRNGGAGVARVGKSHKVGGDLPNVLDPVSQYDVKFVASCPVAMTEKSYSLTFTTPHGSFVASLPSTNCWPRITLQRDGAAAGPPLEPDRRFTRTLDRYLA